MRISLAISLILAILGEMIVSNDGLGYFVLLAQRTFKVPEMYAGIFTLAMFGYVLNRVFLLIEATPHPLASGEQRPKLNMLEPQEIASMLHHSHEIGAWLPPRSAAAAVAALAQTPAPANVRVAVMASPISRRSSSPATRASSRTRISTSPGPP